MKMPKCKAAVMMKAPEAPSLAHRMQRRGLGREEA